MALINFNEIDFNKSIQNENTVINFNDSEIEIVKYLSTNDKYDLIMITLQKAFEKNIYNPFKMDTYFDLNVMYLYTNIVFSNEDRADESKLYDIMKQSGLIDAVKAVIPAEELDYLKKCIYLLSETIIKYRNTFGSVVGSLIEQLPENMEMAKEIIKEFDPDKYKHLIGLASQLKGGAFDFGIDSEPVKMEDKKEKTATPLNFQSIALPSDAN